MKLMHGLLQHAGFVLGRIKVSKTLKYQKRPSFAWMSSFICQYIEPPMERYSCEM